MNTIKFWTVNGDGGKVQGCYHSLNEARYQWESVRKPTQRGSSVWATESEYDKTGCAVTLRTVTLAAA